MTVIDGMVLTAFFFPVILVGWEEGVGLCGSIVDFGETETIGMFQRLTIDGGTTDDIDILVGGAVLQGFFQ